MELQLFFRGKKAISFFNHNFIKKMSDDGEFDNEDCDEYEYEDNASGGEEEEGFEDGGTVNISNKTLTPSSSSKQPVEVVCKSPGNRAINFSDVAETMDKMTSELANLLEIDKNVSSISASSKYVEEGESHGKLLQRLQQVDERHWS